ncbi:MAG: CHAT domain-containing protein [Sterolibacteriaceae bacterium]|nr:CHAT domain-containing protein [Sterolibacteriaceae bacterium]
MLKEEEYFDFVRRDASAKVETTRASLSTTEQPWQARYDQIGARLVALGEELHSLRQIKASFRSAEQNARIGALEADLRVAQQAYSGALDEMRSAFAKLDAQRSGDVASRQLDVSRIGLMDELSKKTGRPVLLLQYIVLDDALRILLTSGATQKAYRLPRGAKEINRAVAELQARLRSPAQDPRPAARALYDILIAPLAADLDQAKAATLMVSLDASLRYVPLSALHDGTRYLAERYAIAVVNEAAGSDNLKDAPQPSWEVAGLGLTRAHEGFAPLPAVKGELEGIVRRKNQPGGVLDGVIYLDQAFTEKSLQRSLSDRLPVLHLASHLQFRPGTEKDSFLLLGDGSKLDLGSLRSRYQFAGVDLITLSACDTAVGGGSGSEVDGLALTVQKNGAKGVLATLWPVADASTGRLMQEFYRLRQSAPQLTKAEALRQAQLELLNGAVKPAASDTARGARPLSVGTQTTAPAYVADPDKPYAHPFYWAPFILMGNWL